MIAPLPSPSGPKSFKVPNQDLQRVIDYYERPTTRWGFDHFLWGSKHYGYYPSGRADVTEREAQVLLQEQVAQSLCLTENDLVLDAGCGQGVVSTYLAREHRPRIDGITIVPFEVIEAQRRAKNEGVQERVTYHLMDYSATEFPDDHFDAIYTTETLSHSQDLRTTLNEFFRILKPGGRIALFEYTLAPDELFSPRERRMLDLVVETSAMMSLKQFRHDRFPDVLERARFAGVREEDITKHMLPSLRRLRRFALVPYQLARLFGLRGRLVNTTAACELYPMAVRGLIRYCIFTGRKPDPAAP